MSVYYSRALNLIFSISFRDHLDTCILNKAELCVIDALPNVNEQVPFISCVERLRLLADHQWETCSKKLNLNTELIRDCIHSFRLLLIEKRNAAEIKALQPPLEGVPWIVVDGQHVEGYPNFISYICKAYKGTDPLPGCSSSVNSVKLDASE
uniref:Gamma-interferon-inducible lysosomal thiol reductase-like isoform X2 n=2 Tax=Nicotiana sylvestris TaxID=4096 RepID=A0A1U7YM33_NICSY|nr:PREDICTED: gamma-interferon-inducible lysosomal thiol reductase-like isoform X2 [Nicotiana sylvestris]